MRRAASFRRPAGYLIVNARRFFITMYVSANSLVANSISTLAFFDRESRLDFWRTDQTDLGHAETQGCGGCGCGCGCGCGGCGCGGCSACSCTCSCVAQTSPPSALDAHAETTTPISQQGYNNAVMSGLQAVTIGSDVVGYTDGTFVNTEFGAVVFGSLFAATPTSPTGYGIIPGGFNNIVVVTANPPDSPSPYTASEWTGG
jgi:hypothetical protein